MTAQSLKSPRKPKGSGHLRRSEILKAAQEIFAEVGYDGATVRKIAEQVGVSSTAIYLHFPDKRAMLLEIATRTLEPIMAEAQGMAGKKDIDARERCRTMMYAYMRSAAEHPQSYAVMVGDAQRAMAEDKGAAHELMVEYHKNFLSVIAELAAQKRLRGKSAPVVAQTLWAGCHGLIVLLHNHPELKWARYEDLRDTMVEALLAGLID